MVRPPGAPRASKTLPTLLGVLGLCALLGCATRRSDFEANGEAEPHVEAPVSPAAPFDFETSPQDWNPRGIAWREHATGLAEARSSGKPVMLIMHAEWCGPCHNYARIFYAPEVVELARRFVMILVDSDRDQGANQRYATDGTYLPRTYFLDPTGQHRTQLAGDHPRFRYFFDQRDPRTTVAAMRLALQ